MKVGKPYYGEVSCGSHITIEADEAVGAEEEGKEGNCTGLRGRTEKLIPFHYHLKVLGGGSGE